MIHNNTLVINGDTHYIKSPKSGRYKWHEWIIPYIIKPLIKDKQARGSKYTIRGLCYTLEGLGVIPKIENEFNKVYEAMSNARENGDLPLDAFVDNTRYIIKDFDDRYESVEQQLHNILHYVGNKDFVDDAKKDLPRWSKQPNYVEMWIEKFSFAEVPRQILKGRDITIVPNRGWSSKTFLHDNLKRLYEKIQTDESLERIVILYLGDLDPSGWAMDWHYQEKLMNIPNGSVSIQFKRVAITKEQLDSFNLRDKTNPNPEVMRKLEKNPNRDLFRRKFGSLFQIELEALEQVPGFEDLLRKEIDDLYNEKIYQNVLNLPENNPTEEQKNKIIKDWMRERL